jgi:hypothetical protein
VSKIYFTSNRPSSGGWFIPTGDTVGTRMGDVKSEDEGSEGKIRNDENALDDHRKIRFLYFFPL